MKSAAGSVARAAKSKFGKKPQSKALSTVVRSGGVGRRKLAVSGTKVVGGGDKALAKNLAKIGAVGVGAHATGVAVAGRAAAKAGKRGHDAADQAGALGFLCVHHAAREDHVHGLGLAHGAGQALRAARVGDDAQLDFRLAEFGVVGGNDEVAHHRQLAAAAQREAADGGNHGLANAADGFSVAGDEVTLVGINKAQLLHGRNVRGTSTSSTPSSTTSAWSPRPSSCA